MKALVIYDSTGIIYNIIYGREDIPEGLESSAIIVEIPTDMRLLSIDVTDPKNPKPIFDVQPGTAVAMLKEEMASNKADTDASINMLTETMDSLLTDFIPSILAGPEETETPPAENVQTTDK